MLSRCKFAKSLSESFVLLKRGLIQMMSANVINKVVGFLSTMVLARVLTTEEYGVWSYALNIYSYFSLITGLGLATGALQFGAEENGNNKAFSFYRYCIRIGIVVDFCLIVVAGVALAVFGLPVEGTKPYILTLLPVLVLEYVTLVGRSVIQSQNRIKEFARVLNVNTIALGVCTCLGAFWGVPGVLVGRYIAIIVSGFYEIVVLAPHLKSIRDAENLGVQEKKRLWHYSLFTCAGSTMNILVFSLDLTLIGAIIKDAEAVAVYQIGMIIPNGLQFIPAAVINSVLPSIIYHRKDMIWIKQNLRKLFVGLAAVNVLICGFTIAFSPFIIGVVSGDNYNGSIPILRVLTLGYLVSGTFRSLSVNTLIAFKRVYYSLMVSVIMCLSDVVLNYVWILRYGIIGAAYATFCVDVLSAALSIGYLLILLRKGRLDPRVEKVD